MFPKDIARRENKSPDRIKKKLTKDVLSFVLGKLRNKKINESQVRYALERIVQGEHPENAVLFEKEDLGVVEERVAKIVRDKPGLSEKAYMWLVMKEFRGKIPGRQVMEIIKKFVK